MSKSLITGVVSFSLFLAACTGTTTTTTNGVTTTVQNGIADPLIKVLTKINNGGIADLTKVEAVASVPNSGLPGGKEDQDGLACAQAGMSVLTQIQAVNAAASGPGSGLLTTVEIASLFKPGSPQYNQAANTLATGCIAKANDVMGPGAVALAGGVLGAMAVNPAILPVGVVP